MPLLQYDDVNELLELIWFGQIPVDIDLVGVDEGVRVDFGGVGGRVDLAECV